MPQQKHFHGRTRSRKESDWHIVRARRYSKRPKRRLVLRRSTRIYHNASAGHAKAGSLRVNLAKKCHQSLRALGFSFVRCRIDQRSPWRGRHQKVVRSRFRSLAILRTRLMRPSIAVSITSLTRRWSKSRQPSGLKRCRQHFSNLRPRVEGFSFFRASL